MLNKKQFLGIPWLFSGYDSVLLLRTRVQSLVRELRSCRPSSQKQKIIPCLSCVNQGFPAGPHSRKRPASSEEAEASSVFTAAPQSCYHRALPPSRSNENASPDHLSWS